MSLLVLLLTGLSTSSFFLSHYLTKIITKNEHSTAQLNFALAQNNLAALSFAWKNTQPHSKRWFKLAKKLAKTQGEAAYQLALYYQSQSTLKFKSEPKSELLLEKEIFWYQNAIRLHYAKASIALAQLYFQQENLKKSAEVLAALPTSLLENINSEAIIINVNIAIAQGKIVEVEKNISKYAKQLKTTSSGRLLLENIKKYQIQLSGSQLTKSNQFSLSCDNSIQLFATNLNHLKRLESLILDFKRQPLNNSVCFSPVRYMPINALDCNNEQSVAIRCDELNWHSKANTINTRYVGIMLPKGGANVHLGILYFDAQDSSDVFAHEISHLLGFVDEYPLVAEHVTCQVVQSSIFSQNISVLKNNYQGEQMDIRVSVLKQLAWARHIKSSTPILQSVTDLKGKHYWQLGTPEEFKHETGVFNAQTCDNSGYSSKGSFSAFKPVSYQTKLQYFALDFPKLYTTLLQKSSKQYSMPSFHYNIALAYFQQSSFHKKSFDQANYWLEQAATWEHDVRKKEAVRQGGF